jgi:serine protease
MMTSKRYLLLHALFWLLCWAIFVVVGCGGGGSTGANESTKVEFIVAGTIQTSETVMIDSDVNDILAPYTPNDGFATAQPIPNPVILGGYVNIAGAGWTGRSTASGDPADYFQVALAAGQTITLVTAEDASADLNLYIYDPSQNLVDSSENPQGPESLQVVADGNYYIAVVTAWGAGNYNLTIGQSPNAATASPLQVIHEFVPGEVIVRFKDDEDSPDRIYSAVDLADSVGMRFKSGAVGREMVLTFDGEGGKTRVFRALGIDPAKSMRAVTSEYDQRMRDIMAIVEHLRRRSDVVSASPNYILKPLSIPDDAQYRQQWHYPLINLPQAWEVTKGSDEVVIAVIDTGVLLNHPDIQNRLDDVRAPGYDFIEKTSISVDGDGIDPDPDDPGDQEPGGSSFHGTHVAGTIAAQTDNQVGVAGVTWKSLIMPLRALGKGGGELDDVIQAIRYAARLPNNSGKLPPRRADIINMSLGGGGFSQTALDAISEARKQGVIVIASAGNESSSTPMYPAAYEGVVSVAAVDMLRDQAWYSNFGQTIDVAAPGGDLGADVNADGKLDGVRSTCGDDRFTSDPVFTYCFYQGTSMAAPHVAGVAALMKAIYPALTPDEFDVLLASGYITEDLGAPGRDDTFGNGLIDAFKAVEAAQDLAGGGNMPAVLIANPASMHFPFGLNDAVISVESKGQPVTGVTLTPDKPWLDVTAQNTDSDGVGDYMLNIDRSGLADGLYTATISISAIEKYTGDPITEVLVPISIQVGIPVVTGGDAGYHYVLLLDADTLDLIAQDEVAFDAGRYTYRFDDIPAGTYRIIAGTDSDNDNGIGDSGEAFGAYPTTNQTIVVEIDGDRTNLNFTSGF